MAYMSKTKRTRMLKRRLIAVATIVAVCVAAILLAPRLMYGTTMATVNGTPIKSKMVAGVAMYVQYAQFGMFVDDMRGSSAKPLTAEEKQQQNLSKQVQEYATLNNLFVPSEVLRQYFAAKGAQVLTKTQIDALTSQAQSVIQQDTNKTLAAHGVRQEHILYYLEYGTLWQAYNDELVAQTPVTDAEAQKYYDDNNAYFQTAGKDGAAVSFDDAKSYIKQSIASSRTGDAITALVAKADVVYMVPVDPDTKKPPETIEALKKILGIAGSSAAAGSSSAANGGGSAAAGGSSAAAGGSAAGGSAAPGGSSAGGSTANNSEQNESNAAGGGSAAAGGSAAGASNGGSN